MSTIIQKGGGRELLHEDDPFALDKQLLGEPTYSHLIEDFMFAVGTFLLTLWHALVGKRDSHVPLIQLPPQSITSDVPVTLTDGYTALEWINAQRAIHGYEPLPEEPPPDAHVAIHQIGTAEPIGWFDSVGKWHEAPPQADHSEMQFAPSDWTNEMATLQVVFLKIDELPERAQERAQALCDEFDSGYGEYVDGMVSSLLKEWYADIGKVGYIIRAFIKAPEPVVAQIKRQYSQAIPYRYVEGTQWE